MFCSNCGKEVKDGDTYCSICGAKVGSVEKKVEKEPEYKKLEIKFSDIELKGLLCKLIYIGLIVLIWRQSQKAMFAMNGYWWKTIDGLMESVFELKRYAEESVLMAKLCYWCYEVAIFGYVAAAVVALLRKEEMAQQFSVIGFLLHLPIFFYSLIGVHYILESWSFDLVQFSEVFETLSEEFWLYVALNIAILICGAKLSSTSNVSGQYEVTKKEPLIRPEMIENRQMKAGDWKCVECGKINAQYIYVCSCGCDKAGSVPEKNENVEDFM